MTTGSDVENNLVRTTLDSYRTKVSIYGLEQS